MATYSDLVKVGGTIYNKNTGKGYSSEAELAADFGLPAMPENWHLNPQIATGSTPPVVQSTTQPITDTWQVGYPGSAALQQGGTTSGGTSPVLSEEDQLIQAVVDLFEQNGMLAPDQQPPTALSDAEITQRWNEISAQIAPYYTEEQKYAQQGYELTANKEQADLAQTEKDIADILAALGKDKQTAITREDQDLQTALLDARQGYASRGLTFSGIRSMGETALAGKTDRNISDIESAYSKNLLANQSKLTSAKSNAAYNTNIAQNAYNRDIQQLSRQQRESTQSAFNELYPSWQGVNESFLR